MTIPRTPDLGPPGGRPAVFLDRDGTLIEHVDYLADPALVRLLPGAARALGRLRAAGFALVLVTNQSAIGRGMLTEDGLRVIHEEMGRLLAEEGEALDAIYYCPDAPGGGRGLVGRDDRKPGPGMLLRAAADLGLDLGASWMIGDTIGDALAGRNAGCLGSILVRTGKPPTAGEAVARREFAVCDDLNSAAELILGPRTAPAVVAGRDKDKDEETTP